MKPTDMKRLEKGRLKAPHLPAVSSPSDFSNFELVEDDEEPHGRESHVDRRDEQKLDDEFRME